MKLSELLKKAEFRALVEPANMEQEITGLKCCDLLSWVMANGAEGDAWITVQTHLNVIAVVSLLEMACIIVPSGIDVEEATLEKAKEQGVTVIASDLDAFGIFACFYEAGLRP